MKLTPASIAALAERAANAASGPARVVMFGSHARGAAAAHSDLDLAVIEPGFTNATDAADEYVRIRSAIGRVGVGVDLLLYSEAEFAQRRLVPGTLPWQIEREGKVLHERRA